MEKDHTTMELANLQKLNGAFDSSVDRPISHSSILGPTTIDAGGGIDEFFNTFGENNG